MWDNKDGTIIEYVTLNEIEVKTAERTCSRCKYGSLDLGSRKCTQCMLSPKKDLPNFVEDKKRR